MCVMKTKTKKGECYNIHLFAQTAALDEGSKQCVS